MKTIAFGLAVLPLHCQAADPAAKHQTPIADTFQLAAPGTVQVQGWVGQKLDLCEKQRIWGLNPDKLVAQLFDHKDSGGWGNWRGEYWGKWHTAAALAYLWQPTEERRAQLEKVVREVMKAQEPDGYLGPHNPEHRLVSWDVWCRKYVLLGLLASYDLTGDKSVLDAASRNADNLINEFAQKKLKVVETGHPVLQGTADSSILEPFALLYQRAGHKRYLEFAQSIIAQWNEPFKAAPQGIHLMENALAGKPPYRNHAYAIMSCFEGICELYRATGDRQYLDAAVRFGQSVRQYERMIDGSVSNQELFCDGARQQTELLEQPQETCATVTWMKLCAQLLRLTGDPVWADELELSLYNAMAGAMTPGAEWFTYHTPLTGERVPSHVQQEDVGLSCCVMSGPRGLMLTPHWAVMASASGPVVNLYAPGTASATLTNGAKITIAQETDYPVGDQVKLIVTPAGRQRFTLRLRIPAWSQRTTLAVNGAPVPCEPGEYAKLDREWSPDDQVTLALDLRGRAVPAPSGAPQLAVMRGPILLALENRLVPASDTAVWLSANAEHRVELQPCAAKPAWAWLAFTAPFQIRPSHFFNHSVTNLALCDFASAGNTWSETNLYRTWLPQPLFLRQAFVTNTWKLLEPGPLRPVIPVAARK